MDLRVCCGGVRELMKCGGLAFHSFYEALLGNWHKSVYWIDSNMLRENFENIC